MIPVPNLLIVAASMRVDCASLPPRPAGPWLRGEYRAVPVVAARQRRMLARLGRRSLERVDLPLARAASGDSGIAPSKYYYLARAAYVGGTARPPAFLLGTSLSVDVDTGGIAYITSFRLSREHGSSEAAVILISDSALKGVVAACLAAE